MWPNEKAGVVHTLKCATTPAYSSTSPLPSQGALCLVVRLRPCSIGAAGCHDVAVIPGWARHTSSRRSWAARRTCGSRWMLGGSVLSPRPIRPAVPTRNCCAISTKNWGGSPASTAAARPLGHATARDPVGGPGQGNREPGDGGRDNPAVHDYPIYENVFQVRNRLLGESTGPIDRAEAALKKLREAPGDRQALQALDQALKQLEAWRVGRDLPAVDPSQKQLGSGGSRGRISTAAVCRQLSKGSRTPARPPSPVTRRGFSRVPNSRSRPHSSHSVTVHPGRSEGAG